MFDASGKPIMGAWAAYLSDALSHEQRLAALARPALLEALDGVDIGSGIPVGLVLSLPAERPGQHSDLTTHLVDMVCEASTDTIEQFAEVRSVSVGNAGGLTAVSVAADLMRDSDIELCLVGGIDSWFEPTMLEWLDDNDRLHGPRGPWGVLPGEAAAFGLLGARGLAERLNIPVLAHVAGLGLGQEAIVLGSEEVCLGRGLTDAWREALRALPSGAQVTDIYIDRNAEPYRADEHGFTLVRCRERFVDPSKFWTPIHAWGDAGAATGLLLTQLAVAAGQRGYARGSLAFVSTSSDSGERAAAVLRLPA